MTAPLLELRAVSKRFVKPLDAIDKVANLLGAKEREQVVHAVDQVSLTIHSGEVVGLVGESGCGKSTLGRMAVGLHGLTDGQRLWRGREVGELSVAERTQAQLAAQMIFQDPYASLNPRLRVHDLIGEAPRVHGLLGDLSQEAYVTRLLEEVGLSGEMLRRFPHQFSGGQRARLGIARALAVKPALLVCDEAVAALDVSIQAQVINLFMQLRANFGLTYLFISHDLGVVRHLSDRVVIMYLGRVVETAPTEALFDTPLHPYTQALVEQIPSLEKRQRRYLPIKGEIPSPLNPPSGCHFHPRCPKASSIAGNRCATEAPMLREVATGRTVACHAVLV